MKRTALWLAIAISALLFGLGFGFSQAHKTAAVNDRIQRVENGLLPGIVLKGQSAPMKLTERLAPPKVEKKSTGFFGFGGGSNAKEALDDKLASTIVLCYGYVTAYANPELILSRLDVHILHNIIPLIPKAKTPLAKSSSN